MKKYIIASFVVLLMTTAMPVSATATTQISTEAKAALIKELTIKLNELVISLNALLAGQDARIKSEVSNSRVSAEIYYTINQKTGFTGACKDVQNRIINSLTSSKATDILKTLDMSCFDSKDYYAVSIKISKGYACADSTGFSGTSTKAVTGTVCR